MNASVQLIERLKVQLARMINKADKLSRRLGDAPWLKEFVDTQKAALARLEEQAKEMGAVEGALPTRKARAGGEGKARRATKKAAAESGEG